MFIKQVINSIIDHCETLIYDLWMKFKPVGKIKLSVTFDYRTDEFYVNI